MKTEQGITTSVAVVILAIAAGVMTWTKELLRFEQQQTTAHVRHDPLYLPSEDKLRLITLGFNNFASDVLWFNTVNYFGREYDSTKDYRWLGQMCSLVTSLDPHSPHVYEFCSSMLSWIAKEPEKSAELLRRGVDAMPNEWRLRYLLGFTYWYFLERKDLARVELEATAKLPGTPPFVASMASRLMVADDDPQTAIAFLSDMIKNSKDAHAQQALTEKLRLAKISVDINNLKKAMAVYEQKKGARVTDLKQLAEARIIKGTLTDPFGGTYYLDKTSGEIKTTSGKKGLTFAGKTVKTGLMKREWSMN